MWMDDYSPLPFPKETEGVQDLPQSTFCLKWRKEQIPHRICSIEPEEESAKRGMPGPQALRLAFPWAWTAPRKLFNLHLSHPPHFLPATLSSLLRREWPHPQFPGHSYSQCLVGCGLPRTANPRWSRPYSALTLEETNMGIEFEERGRKSGSVQIMLTARRSVGHSCDHGYSRG